MHCGKLELLHIKRSSSQESGTLQTGPLEIMLLVSDVAHHRKLYRSLVEHQDTLVNFRGSISVGVEGEAQIFFPLSQAYTFLYVLSVVQECFSGVQAPNKMSTEAKLKI